jgi:hypothetical protein
MAKNIFLLNINNLKNKDKQIRNITTETNDCHSYLYQENTIFVPERKLLLYFLPIQKTVHYWIIISNITVAFVIEGVCYVYIHTS